MDQHPVLSLIFKRAQEYSLPGKRADDRRLALVVEGGAMRGVVSAGMISALEDLGLRDVFDDIYATSVGVITGAYFIASQGNFGTTTYVDDLRDSRFFSWRRLLKGEPPLSLKYAYDELTKITKPLDTDAVISSKIRLHPIAACLESGQPEDLSDYKTAEDLRLRFKASSCMPFLAGGPIEVNGKSYFDGGIFDSFPYRHAIEDGVSDIMILHSWPIDTTRPNHSLIERTVGGFIVKRYGRPFLSAYQSRIERYNKDLADLNRRVFSPERPFILPVSPGQSALISHLEQDKELIIKAKESGHEAIANLFLDFRKQ